MTILLLAAAAPGQAAPDGRKILEKAAAKQGGGHLAARGAVKDLYIDILKLTVEHDGNLFEGSAKRWYRAPTEKRAQALIKTWTRDSQGEVTSALGPLKAGHRRTVVWTRKGKGKAQIIAKTPDHEKRMEEIEQTETLVRTFLLRNLLGPEATFTVEGKETGHGRTAWRIRRTAKDERPMLIWVDVRDHATVWGVSLLAVEPGEHEQTFCFSGFKRVKGLRIPRKFVVYTRTFEQVKAGEKAKKPASEAIIESVDFNTKLGEAPFVKPD